MSARLKTAERLNYEAQRAFTVVELRLHALTITAHDSLVGDSAFILGNRLLVSPLRFSQRSKDSINLNVLDGAERLWLRSLLVIDCEQ